MPRTRDDGWTPFVGVIYGVREIGSSEYRYVGLTMPDREAVFFESLELVMSEDLSDLGTAEVRWIEKLRTEGNRLLNLNDGGLGNHGYSWTEEQRVAASVRHRGRKRSEALKGRPMPSSVRSAHTRHHTKKAVFKETCKHCQDERITAEQGNDND